MNKTMIISAVIAAAALAGCSLSGAVGNRSSDIKASIKTLSERYGVEFKLKKKKFSGGASVNAYVPCPETGDREIYVFQASAGSRVPSENAVKTDYIYVRYGAEALAAIKSAAESVYPGCKVEVTERQYNHLTYDMYDSSTDLAGYLSNNYFSAYVYAPQLPRTRQELIREYDKLAETFSAKGIVCKDLCLCCPESMDKVIPADHIMCSNDDQYENNTDTAHTEPVRLKASIALEPAIGGSEPYSVTINGEYVNNNSDQGE